MSKQTHYIVQTRRNLFVQKDNEVKCYVDGYGIDKAAHLSLSEARRLWREERMHDDPNTPRRFPRILKVTVETKTITPNH